MRGEGVEAAAFRIVGLDGRSALAAAQNAFARPQIELCIAAPWQTKQFFSRTW
jgi:hypothetical protein